MASWSAMPGVTASFTRLVTSFMETSIISSRPGTLISWLRRAAVKPFFTRSLWAVDTWAMAPRPTWWLVTTRPSRLTKAPVPPGKRTVASCRFFSQATSRSTPYFALICLTGMLSKVHMPSSARSAGRASRRARAERRMEDSGEKGTTKTGGPRRMTPAFSWSSRLRGENLYLPVSSAARWGAS